MSSPEPAPRFQPALVAGLDEPVRRFFAHAIREGAALAGGEDRIVARFDLPPEQPEVHAQIDEQGALLSVSALRWSKPGKAPFAYVPCGCEVHAERRFGALTIPSRISVGWWFGTPRYEPFFRARIQGVERG